jgi:hypothetical protein
LLQLDPFVKVLKVKFPESCRNRRVLVSIASAAAIELASPKPPQQPASDTLITQSNSFIHQSGVVHVTDRVEEEGK